MPSVTAAKYSQWCKLVLTSWNGRQLLVAFWTAFAIAGLGVTSPSFLARAAGGLGQFALATLWVGYPIALFSCVEGRRRRSVVAIGLIICALLGYWLSVFVYAGNGGFARSTLSPIAGAMLVLVPFVAGSHALANAERHEFGTPKAGVVPTTLMLFALPFWGAYVHERFLRIQTALRGLPTEGG